MNIEEFLNGDEAPDGPLWCAHAQTVKDDEHYVLCLRCGDAFYAGPLREQDLWDAADAIWGYGYSGPGLPPSIQRRLED